MKIENYILPPKFAKSASLCLGWMGPLKAPIRPLVKAIYMWSFSPHLGNSHYLCFCCSSEFYGRKGGRKSKEGIGSWLGTWCGSWFGYYLDVIASDVLRNLELFLLHKERFLGFPLVGFALASGVISISCILVLWLIFYCFFMFNGWIFFCITA